MVNDKYLTELRAKLREEGKSKCEINEAVKYARRLMYANLPVIFDLTHLSQLLDIEASELGKILYFSDINLYREVQIPKKSGGKRTLLIPAPKLKKTQSWILHNILYNINVSAHANGFCKGKSIVSNAKVHLGQECLINLDIENFFPSITITQVFRVFAYYGYSKEVSYFLAKLCTFKGVLPQGSPASPYISNIISLKLDKRLSALSEKYSARYSRYADDITFSGGKGLENILPVAEEIINDEGFKINNKKTHISHSHERQSVTGLIVNEGEVKVSKAYKKKLKSEIYFCKKYGVKEHQKRTKNKNRFFKDYIYGKVHFVNMVEPELAKALLSQLDEIDWNN